MERTYIVTGQTWAGDHYDRDTRRITAVSRAHALQFMEQECPGHDEYYITETL